MTCSISSSKQALSGEKPTDKGRYADMCEVLHLHRLCDAEL